MLCPMTDLMLYPMTDLILMTVLIAFVWRYLSVSNMIRFAASPGNSRFAANPGSILINGESAVRLFGSKIGFFPFLSEPHR